MGEKLYTYLAHAMKQPYICHNQRAKLVSDYVIVLFCESLTGRYIMEDDIKFGIFLMLHALLCILVCVNVHVSRHVLSS